MTAEENKTKQQEQRGAGSGENAVATRSRDTTKNGGAAEGDIAKGKIDPEDPEKRIAMKDRRAYLEDQALKNQQANDELNEIQEEQNEKFRKLQLENNAVIDPDKQRDESMETARAALKMHDPDERKKQADAGAKGGGKFGSPTTADFKQGQAAG